MNASDRLLVSEVEATLNCKNMDIAEAAEIEACLRADVARLLKSSEALEERNAQLEGMLQKVDDYCAVSNFGLTHVGNLQRIVKKGLKTTQAEDK